MLRRNLFCVWRDWVGIIRGQHTRGTQTWVRRAASDRRNYNPKKRGPAGRSHNLTHLIAILALTGIVVLSGTEVKAQPVPGPKPPQPTTRGAEFPLSLADAVFLGLRNNRTVKSAYIDRIAQKFDLYVSETRFRPTANINAAQLWVREDGIRRTKQTITPTASWLIPTGAQFQFSWARSDTHTSGHLTNSDTAEFSLTQPLLKGAGYDVNMAPIRVAKLQSRINRLTLKSTVSSTVTQIIEAYRTLIAAQDTVTIARQTLDRTQDLLKTNKYLVDAGRMAASEIVQTEATLASQKVSTLQAEQQRNSAQIALLRLLAMDLRTNIVAMDPLTPKPVAIDMDQAIQIALNNRVDYLSQQLTLEQDRQNLIVAKNNRLWDLSVVGSLQYQRSHSSATPNATLPNTAISKDASIGLQLNIPIGDATLEQQEVQARVSVRKEENQLEDARQQVEAQVRDAVQNVDIAWRQYEASRQAQMLANKTVNLEHEKLRIGRASNFEVLTFEGNLSAANSQLLSAGISYLNALTTLDDQLGTTLDTWRIRLND